MAKPKRLNLSPEDRLIGVRPRERRDLFAGCNEVGMAWFQRDAYEFQRIYCQICKNADCLRAKGATSPWQTRMQEQVDYLINTPNFSDLSSPEHKAFAEMAFDSLKEKAERLEIARQRQDWEIPEGPTDGYDRVSEPETTDGFDAAVRALAKAKGKKEPELPAERNEDGPAHFAREDEDSEYEYETQYPSSDGKSTYHVALTKDGRWSCECDGFRHRRKCKHLEAVRAWYEEELQRMQELEHQERQEQAPPQKPPPAAVQDSRVPVVRPYNTPMPPDGVMVGGDVASGRSSRPRQRDAWEVSDERVVEPGATVTLKGDKK